MLLLISLVGESMKRKYLSEFALHVYSSHGSMFYPADIPLLDFKEDYHIYMVNLIPKLQFDMESLKQYKDHISIDIILKSEEETVVENIRFAVADINHEELNISSDKPRKTLYVTTGDGENGLAFRVMYLYIQYADRPLSVEVLYIGQSFGKGGSRKALDRLKSHSTLQKIMADISFNEEIRDIAISLWEFSPGFLASFDGISKSYEKSDSEDKAHIHNIFLNGQRYDQVINITEAALIHYFKPEYNEKFKNNFPLMTHNGYKHYYDLDYNALLVELDQETINGSLYSNYREYDLYPKIEYTLHPENIRRSMFDIFSDTKK
jgi:hypothetical protein